MSAPPAASQSQPVGAVRPAEPAAATERHRARLLAEAAHHASTIARCAAALASSERDGATDLGRAMNALRMYGARQAIEEIEAALARLDGGPSGISHIDDRSPQQPVTA